MYISVQVGQWRVMLAMWFQTHERLSTTCFRGRDVRRSGNFFRWEKAWNMFHDPFVRKALIAELANSIPIRRARDAELPITPEMGADVQWVKGGRFKTARLSITCPWPVGWAGTMPLDTLVGTTIEMRPLCSAKQRLAPHVADLQFEAPQTRVATLVYELTYPKTGFTVANCEHLVIIHTVYPGVYVDTHRCTDRLFIGFENPGGDNSWVCDD